nr:HDOD domain-containing protein [uncultured Bacillus sp.]
MEVFVARQPIFNLKEEIVGYELLYRNDMTNACTNSNGDQATAEVIINSFLNIGLERMTEGKACFIHFTENLLEQKLPVFLNQKDIAIIISNSVRPSHKLVEICRELNKLGYIIEVKESFFEDRSYSDLLLPCVDYISVDFRDLSSPSREWIESMAVQYQIKLIAEKIETKEAYHDAKEMGCELFKGYYFSKPLIISAVEIPSVYSSYYELQNTSLEELNIDQLEEWLAKDLSLSFKLLKVFNQFSTDKDSRVCSVRGLISMLGADVIQKWVQLLTNRVPIEKQEQMLSEELVRMTLTRAKLCESIAKQIGSEQKSAFYLTGLLSFIKEYFEGSMEEILEGLPLKENIYDALIGKDNLIKAVLDLAEAVEQAKWSDIKEICHKLNIQERYLFKIYAESINWASKIMQSERSSAVENTASYYNNISLI